MFCLKFGYEKRELEFFCKICKVVICNVCVLIDYDGYVKIFLEEVVNECRVELKFLIEIEKERL